MRAECFYAHGKISPEKEVVRRDSTRWSRAPLCRGRRSCAPARTNISGFFPFCYQNFRLEPIFLVSGTGLTGSPSLGTGSLAIDRHPDGRLTSARSHQRASRTEGPCVFLAPLTHQLLKRKVPQGCSPAEEYAGSLTPFGMTAQLRAELAPVPKNRG